MSRRVPAVLMAVLLVLLVPFSVYASEVQPLEVSSVSAVATPSDATPSNAELNYITETLSDATRLDDLMQFSSISMNNRSMLKSSIDVAPTDNSISYSGAFMTYYYYDMSSVLQHIDVPLNSNGYAVIPRPSDFVTPYAVGLLLNKKSLPPSGTYTFDISFTSDTGIDYTSELYVMSYRTTSNAAVDGTTDLVSTVTFSGDYSASTIISIGNFP